MKTIFIISYSLTESVITGITSYEWEENLKKFHGVNFYLCSSETKFTEKDFTDLILNDKYNGDTHIFLVKKGRNTDEMIRLLDWFKFKKNVKSTDLPELTDVKDDVENIHSNIKLLIDEPIIGRTTMNIDALNIFLNKITKEDNGISAAAVINSKEGEITAKSDAKGVDGDIDLEKVLNWLAPLDKIKKSFSTDTDTVESLTEKVGDFDSTMLSFEKGALILNYIEVGEQLTYTVIYINLKRATSGAARANAPEYTEEIKKLIL